MGDATEIGMGRQRAKNIGAHDLSILLFRHACERGDAGFVTQKQGLFGLELAMIDQRPGLAGDVMVQVHASLLMAQNLDQLDQLLAKVFTLEQAEKGFRRGFQPFGNRFAGM